MKNNTSTNSMNTTTNKKEGKGNGNSVINNHEYGKNKANDYVSGDATRSSSSHNFSQNHL